jgi:hypothetical protein
LGTNGPEIDDSGLVSQPFWFPTFVLRSLTLRVGKAIRSPGHRSIPTLDFRNPPDFLKKAVSPADGDCDGKTARRPGEWDEKRRDSGKAGKLIKMAIRQPASLQSK